MTLKQGAQWEFKYHYTLPLSFSLLFIPLQLPTSSMAKHQARAIILQQVARAAVGHGFGGGDSRSDCACHLSMYLILAPISLYLRVALIYGSITLVAPPSSVKVRVEPFWSASMCTPGSVKLHVVKSLALLIRHLSIRTTEFHQTEFK